MSRGTILDDQSGAWTCDPEIVVLDSGVVLTPWGNFRVSGMVRGPAYIGNEMLPSCRITLKPIEDQPEVRFER